MHQLRTEGVLNDLTKIEALPSVARGYVITDAGWNLLDFAAPLHALTSGSLLFRTLPIQGYATIDGQSANVVNSATIQPIVQAACYLKPGGPGAQPSAQGAQLPGVAYQPAGDGDQPPPPRILLLVRRRPGGPGGPGSSGLWLLAG
jgi:hypothetical protein